MLCRCAAHTAHCAGHKKYAGDFLNAEGEREMGPLDEYWINQDIVFDYTADLAGTADRYEYISSY